ncbi:hypothetical protein RN70_09830 [Staphylococcus schleiferi]|uniref:hypothetical protein n=1 Tax=Staphylococcus coagulans TaxID=74706 RepID=UPI000679EDF4|nr:hypothetical protein RN70_09830 [Staphylococcus schleiferi]
MKIKTKKEMNLHELIKWAWENDIKNKDFSGNQAGVVEITSSGFFKTYSLVGLDELFTVEVEEEITEKTVIPRLIEVYEKGSGILTAEVYKNRSFRHILEIDAFRVDIKAFYMLNDDMTMTLIWKDGEMVE